jgi:hypothetical protein
LVLRVAIQSTRRTLPFAFRQRMSLSYQGTRKFLPQAFGK